MEPKIVTVNDRMLVGMKIKTSLSNNKTGELWQRFMPRRNEIVNGLTSRYFSIQTYDPDLSIEEFNQNTIIEKWAAVEVTAYDIIPKDMAKRKLKGGLYAVFIHKGPVTTFQTTMQYILKNWLPNAGYALDDRDIFEILDEKYLGPMHPDSEEEVWIPIK